MLFRLFFRLLALLPLSLLHPLGAAAGWLVYAASPSYRRLLRQNMALALGEEAAADPALRSSAIASAGKMVLELTRIWLNPLEKAAAQVTEVFGWEHVEAAWRQGKGIIFLTPHLGCFEITAQYCALHAPITVLYRPPKQAWIHPLIEAGRARAQLHIAAADLSGVRSLLKALKRGEAVGLLPDQAPRKGEGLWLPFFGKPAYTMTLAARLTEANAAVLLVWGERLPGGKGYHFHLRPPLEPIAGTLEERAAAINREIEALVRGCPGQYLWGYNRYKHPAGAEPPPAAVSSPQADATGEPD